MKTLIKIIFWILVVSLFSISFWDSLLEEKKSALEWIKWWKTYVNRIDSITNRYKGNERVLNLLSSRLSEIEKVLDWKTWSKYDDLRILIAYFALQVDTQLDNLRQLKEEDIKEEIEDNKDTIIDSEVDNKPVKSDHIFPWFTDVYYEEKKTLLAWDDDYVYKQSVSALYEEQEIWKVIFYIGGPDVSNIKNAIDKAELYLEWSIIDTVSSSKVDILSPTKAKITFDNLEDFIITQNIRQLRLNIKTSNIWYEKVWKTIKDLYVLNVWFTDIKWLSSWSEIPDFSVNETGEEFTIAPAVISVTLKRDLVSWSPELNIRWFMWNNSIDWSNNSPNILLKKLILNKLWSSNDSWVVYKIYNTDNSSDNIVWTVNWNNIEFDLSTLLYTNKRITNSTRWEDYRIVISWTNPDTTLNLSIEKDGVIYDVEWVSWATNININASSYLDIWSKSY